MTPELFALMLTLILVNCAFAFVLSNVPAIKTQISRESRAMIPVVSVIGILFGLFTSFTSSDINQRASTLQLATDRELSAARSLLNLATGIGPAGTPVREALVEYLQTVASTERAWLENGANGAAPGDAPVYSLSLIATVFAEQAKASASIKSMLISRVDDLVNARTERLTRTIRRADVPLWMSLVLMAVVTQLTGALALSGSRLQTMIFLSGYTLVAVTALAYLAWADRLIGPSRIAEHAALFEALVARTQ